MQVKEIQEKIKENDFSLIYVLHGDECFLIDEMKQAIVDHALQKETFEFNFSLFDMEETPIDIAMEEANVMPFIGERRVIVIKNPIFLTGKKDVSQVTHDLPKLEKYIENPSPSTVVIFLAPYEKLDARKKIVKQLKKKACLLSFSTPDEATVYRILKERAAAQNVVLTKEANARLLQNIGPHLNHLVQEVDKMILFVGNQGKITDRVVELLSSKTLESNVFALIDKVIQNRLDESFVILHDLLKQKEEPIKLLALLTRQVRIIYQVKALSGDGDRPWNIAKRLRLHPYAVKVALGQAQSFQEEELLRILNECIEADFYMKTGKMDKRLTLELLLSRCQPMKKENVQS